MKNNGQGGKTLDNKDKTRAKDKEPSVKNSEGVKISDNKDKSNHAKDKNEEPSVKNNGQGGKTLDNKDKSEDAKDKEPSVTNSEGVKISDNKDKSDDAKDKDEKPSIKNNGHGGETLDANLCKNEKDTSKDEANRKGKSASVSKSSRKSEPKQHKEKQESTAAQSSRRSARPTLDDAEVERVRRNLSNMGEEERRQRILKQQRVR